MARRLRESALAFALVAAALAATLIALKGAVRLLLPQLGARQLAALDATPALCAAWRAGARDLYDRVNIHLEPEGHRVVADLLESPVGERLLTR